ncbi:hypothetical protein K504DRAFT_521905 [Pleomassaria siparia CBS 279.74]|uniref:Uncharacterized protein n=1 Tax=Pleomassaria siparia CBS 279.74 TaxID=1314801 RepID=A0A6G1KI53_9PLEO|nr:hypothetical protein K504DRAFT_521905 [Pleomassaria siparia CBS 279.74]
MEDGVPIDSGDPDPDPDPNMNPQPEEPVGNVDKCDARIKSAASHHVTSRQPACLRASRRGTRPVHTAHCTLIIPDTGSIPDTGYRIPRMSTKSMYTYMSTYLYDVYYPARAQGSPTPGDALVCWGSTEQSPGAGGFFKDQTSGTGKGKGTGTGTTGTGTGLVFF